MTEGEGRRRVFDGRPAGTSMAPGLMTAEPSNGALNEGSIMNMNRAALSSAVIAAAGYATLFRLGATWGATADERRRPLPGDELVRAATLLTTHGITIDAPPDAVWPWLVQMGWGRAGWYTYRWVDQLLFPANGPSATRIVPQLQKLDVGDRILDGPPETDCWFSVEVLDPPRTMVLRSTTHVPVAWRERFGAQVDWVWSWHLSSQDPDGTRLVQRNRMRLRPRWFEAAFLGFIVPADLVMARSHLRAIKRRAEFATAHSLAA